MAPIQISGILLDDQDIPIIGRDVSLVYNGTEYYNITTVENGAFSSWNIDSTNITGDYEYTIIFYSKTGNQILGPFTLTVRAQPQGPAMDAMVIILWIAVISVELIIALIIITRKRFSYSRFSRQFYLEIRTMTKNNMKFRWI